MATFDTVQLPDDSTNTGKLEDHAVVDTDKFREVVVLGDPDTRANVTAVQNSDPAGTEFGPVVRDVNTPAIKTSVAAINTKTPSLGQAAMAGSVPVAIASNQSAVPVSGTVAVTGVSTAANQETQIAAEQAIQAAVEIIDDWDESDRAKVNPIVGGAGVQGNTGVVTAITQRVTLATDVALPTGTNTLGKISDITTSVTPGTSAAHLGKAEDAAHGSGDTGVMALAVANEANATFGADGDYVPLGTDREGSSRAIGNRAHDAVDAGNPVKVGMKAIAFGANPTAVAAGDRTDVYANRAGVPFVLGGHPNILTLEAAYTAAQTDTAIVTVSSGAKIVVTAIEAVCDAANSVDVGLRIGFGATNTPTTTGVVLSHPGILALSGSGIGKGNGAGIVGVGADGEDLRITSEVPTGGSLRVVVSYFTIES